MGLLFARHDTVEDQFIISPTINCEYALFYYFLKMDTKMTNILLSIKIIKWDIYLLFLILYLLIFLFCMIKFHKTRLKNKFQIFFDLLFNSIRLVLQNSVRFHPKFEQGLSQKFILLFVICITFFFINFFIASLNNSYIELDKTDMLDTIEGLFFWLNLIF